MPIAVPTGAGNVSTAAATTSTSTLTLPLPGNTTRGDVLVAIVAADRADTVYVPQTEWVRISTERPGSQVRELAMFHAFTKEGTPPPPVFTFPGAARISAAIFRVTGASQNIAVSGAGEWAATLDSTNTLGLTVQATGAPAGGVTFAAAYSNTNAQQGATTAVTFNGAPADVHLTSHGSGAPGASSATSQSIKVSTSTGPFTVVWGKTIANGQGLAVTIPEAPAPAWEARVMLGGELWPATLAIKAGDQFIAPQDLGTN